MSKPDYIKNEQSYEEWKAKRETLKLMRVKLRDVFFILNAYQVPLNENAEDALFDLARMDGR